MQFFSRNRVGLALAVIKLCLPFILQNSIYELHRDEMLYLQQGHHLAWGFMEVPPLLSLFAWLTWLLGGGFFWVKFWPALIGAANVIVICAICRQMGGGYFAQIVAGLCFITGAYLRVNFLFQPNFLEIFFWTVGAYAWVKYANTHQNKFIYFLAVTLACAWMTKYSVVFFAIGIGVGLVVSHRNIFLNKHFYLAAFICLLIITPNLLWQYNHRWPVVHHMKELRETQLQYLSPVSFLTGQVLMHLPYFFVWIAGLVWLLAARFAKPYRLLGITYLVIIALLMATNGKDYYTLGSYPMLLAAGGVALQQFTELRFTWIRPVAIIIIILLFVPLVPLLLPVWRPEQLSAYYKTTGFSKTGFLYWEDRKEHPLPQDFADMQGWNELGTKVSNLYYKLPRHDRDSTLLFCSSYALAGAVAYYGHLTPQSTNASFLLWMPNKFHNKNLLYVGQQQPDSNDAIIKQFAGYTLVDSVQSEYARERGAKIWLYRNGPGANALIEQMVKQKKDEFKR